MARLSQAKTEEEIKSLGVANVRIAYNKLAKDYNRIVDGDLYYCHRCNDFHHQRAFYSDSRFASGLYPECIDSLLNDATDFDKKTNAHTDNKEKTKEVFRKLDLPFIDTLYEQSLNTVAAASGEKNRSTAYQQMLVMVKSLSQYRGKHWKDSEFNPDEVERERLEVNENSRKLKSAKKRFGRSYNSDDLLYLEDQYNDWVARYSCENKAQEVLFKNLCLVELNIEKAQREGKDTKDLLKSEQEIMASLQIKPSQSNSNALTEAKTFGQLIQKWEDEWDGGKPIPEPDEDFKDVDKVGTYIDVFFKGHLAKMMGLKGGFSALYDKYMKKYAANKVEDVEDEDTESIFNQLFGKME